MVWVGSRFPPFKNRRIPMPSVVGCAFPRLPLRGRLSAFRLSLSGFALVAGVLMAALPAAASSTATTTTLAVTSGGIAVTTVDSGSVVTLTATVKAGTTPVSPGLVKFCDADGGPLHRRPCAWHSAIDQRRNGDLQVQGGSGEPQPTRRSSWGRPTESRPTPPQLRHGGAAVTASVRRQRLHSRRMAALATTR